MCNKDQLCYFFSYVKGVLAVCWLLLATQWRRRYFAVLPIDELEVPCASCILHHVVCHVHHAFASCNIHWYFALIRITWHGRRPYSWITIKACSRAWQCAGRRRAWPAAEDIKKTAYTSTLCDFLYASLGLLPVNSRWITCRRDGIWWENRTTNYLQHDPT